VLWFALSTVDSTYCCAQLLVFCTTLTAVLYSHCCALLSVLWTALIVVFCSHCCALLSVLCTALIAVLCTALLPLLCSAVGALHCSHCCALLPLLYSALFFYNYMFLVYSLINLRLLVSTLCFEQEKLRLFIYCFLTVVCMYESRLMFSNWFHQRSWILSFN